MGVWIGDRVSAEDHANSTTIVISPLRSLWKEWLLTFWLAGFTFVGGTMIYLAFVGLDTLNRPDNFSEENFDNQRIYLFVFIGFWTYFEYKIFRAWAWYKYGKEYILIGTEAISFKKSWFGYGKANKFLFENIKKLGIRTIDEGTFGHFFENAYWTLGIDRIGFEHFGKNQSFGRRLDEKSCKLLLRLIDDRVKKMLRKRK